ncbi:MAG: XdhC family protein [Chloroflexota bacterium]|nr:XdhC family protein [Chloroflexota bacterium]
MLNEVYREIARCLDQGGAVAVATVASVRGSTPRRPGAKMVIRADGSFCGSIGGGCGEAEVVEEALEVLRTGVPKLVRVDLLEAIESEDRICGGVMEVWVEGVGGGGGTRDVGTLGGGALTGISWGYPRGRRAEGAAAGARGGIGMQGNLAGGTE